MTSPTPLTASTVDEPAGSAPAPAEAAEPAAEAIPAQLGRYRITTVLGRGSFGVVYQGYDDELQRPVAIKVMRGGRAVTAEAKARFEREARAVSALNHPNILTLFDVGEAAGALFIATEFVQGVTLRQLIDAGPVPVEIVLRTTVARILAASPMRRV